MPANREATCADLVRRLSSCLTIAQAASLGQLATLIDLCRWQAALDWQQSTPPSGSLERLLKAKILLALGTTEITPLTGRKE